MRYLLDTNHLGETVRVEPAMRQRIVELHAQGHRFGTIIPTLGELHDGLAGTHDPVAARRRLDGLLRTLRVWPLLFADAQASGAMAFDLRTRGRVLSLTDIMLAVVALRMSATLLTTDRDFEALPEVPTEDWLPEPPAET